MKSISREFVRFVFMGGINTVASYLLYAFLLLLVPYLLAYSISFVVTVFSSYYLHSRFVFRVELRWAKAVLYQVIYMFQYLLGVIMLWVLVDLMSIDSLVAPAIVLFVAVPITYLLGRMIMREGASDSRERILKPLEPCRVDSVGDEDSSEKGQLA